FRSHCTRLVSKYRPLLHKMQFLSCAQALQTSKHELYQKTRCWNFRMQVATERVSFRQISIAAQSRMVIRSSLWLRSGQGGFGGSHAPGGRTLNLAEPDREIYDPSLTSQDQSSILTESHEREALEP